MKRLTGETFPWGTLLANMIGCFAIGFCVIWVLHRKLPKELELAIITGGLGALTTFSAFSYDALAMFLDERPVAAGSYVAVSVIAGLVVAYAGIMVGKSVFV